MGEQEIISLLMQKDDTGMDALLKQYGPLMRYVIAPIVSNPQDQEDCFSEAAMRVWDKIALFNGQRGSWKAWLTAVTRNTALNYARAASYQRSAEEIPEEAPSPALTPEETMMRQERQNAIERALLGLSAKDRMLFYRKYYYLQSTSQIASELGMTERSIEGKLYRIKKQLRKMLGGEGYA